jgi:hypothetical protein
MYGNKSRDWIRMWLRYTSDDLGDPGFDNFYGYGRVNARTAVEQAIPEHGIMLVDLNKPRYDEPLVSQYINTTILNLGASDESNVEVQFIVNGTIANTTHVSLGNGTSTKLCFKWTPAVLAKYNVTIYAVPVSGEDIKADNVKSGWISVQYPLINPVPGQWAVYTITSYYSSSRYYTRYLNLTYDHYVEPYLMYVTESVTYPDGYAYVYGMIVNTMDRRVESDYWDYYFWGLIETDIKMGSTVNLLGANATVDQSRFVDYGIYPVDCWGLLYAPYYGTLEHYYYDKTSGLCTGYDYASDYYRDEIRLTSSNFMKIPSYEHELVVRLDAPPYLARGNSTLLNATVFNIGSDTENNVELSFLVDGSEVRHLTIASLQNGTSYTSSYAWTPTLEDTYSWSASVQPVADETYLGNNVADRSVTVSHPIINPAENQYANYAIYYGEPDENPDTLDYSLNFTYCEQISPYQINVTVATRYSYDDYWYSRWMVVNTFTRIVEYDSSSYWTWTSFVGWIETNVTLGSTVAILDYNGTVVGNKVIYTGGRFIDCWKIQVHQPYYPESFTDVFLYDKASGLLLREVESWYEYTWRLEPLETNVPLGFRFDHDLTTEIELTGRPVVGSNIVLNATVYNTGLANETDFHMQLMIEGITVYRETINYLSLSGWYSLNYTWVPTKVSNYTISTLADQVPGEQYTANNAASTFLNASSQFYSRTYIAHQWVGDESPAYTYAEGSSLYHSMQFSFPFYEQNYQWMYISDDGLIVFEYPQYGYNYSVNDLAMMRAIAVAWGDWTTLDASGIGIWENSSEVHVMWNVQASSNLGLTVTFEAILRADGMIQLNYGSDNVSIPVVIGVSDGVSRMKAEYAVDLNSTRSIVFSHDDTAPSGITDLRFGRSPEYTITLTWTAPGDDDGGDATGYIVKYSTLGPINDSNWESATTYDQSWVPMPVNSSEAHQLSGLNRLFRYWFAIKTCDGVPNYSEVSNSPSGVTAAPAAVVLVTSITATAIPVVTLVGALILEARAKAADARRRALRLRRWRASIRRRKKKRPATLGKAAKAQPKSQ